MVHLRLRRNRSRQIMEDIVVELRSASEPIAAEEIADKIGRYRSTVQRYLHDLDQDGYVDLILDRGSRGRPKHLYQWRDEPSPPPRPNPGMVTV
ncbi:HTH domain-containing protein [Frankia sp. CcWB3]